MSNKNRRCQTLLLTAILCTKEISTKCKQESKQSIDQTSQFLLPQHLREQLVMLVEKVGHFAVLVVTFGRHKDAMHRLPCQVLTNLRNWKHDLLHGAVTAYNLDLSSML